jgi:hypothetical protein
MTIFSYTFAMAISIALGIAIGTAYVREHYYGVWTRKTIAVLTAIVIAFGLILGWAISTWLTWALSSGS